MKIFKRQDISVRINSYITKVTEKTIFINDGSEMSYGLLVWAAGNSAAKLVVESSFLKNNRNKIIIDKFLRVTGENDIYSIGDCAEITETPFPVTAQVAQQEGKYLGKTLNKLAKGKAVKPFKFNNFGMLAYVGSHKALANTKQVKLSGFTTWLLWRSVYLTKLVSTKNKMLVLFDWFKNFLFGRDVSNF